MREMLAKEERRATQIINTASVCDLNVCLQRYWWDWQAKGTLSLATVGPGWYGCRMRKPGDILFVGKKSFLTLLRPLLYFSSTSSTLMLSTFPDIACPWKPCSLPLITVLADAVILQNVTVTSLCYLQGGFMLCLHLENALLADIHFSP